MPITLEEKHEIEREAYKEACVGFYRDQLDREHVQPEPKLEPPTDPELTVVGMYGFTWDALKGQDFFILRARKTGKYSTVLYVSEKTRKAFRMPEEFPLYFDLTCDGEPCFNFTSPNNRKGIYPTKGGHGLRFEAVRPNPSAVHPEPGEESRCFFVQKKNGIFEIDKEFYIIENKE